MAHTKGEYRAEQHAIHECWEVWADNSVVAQVYGSHNESTPADNARLFAAAPDLLEACRKLMVDADRFQQGARDGYAMGCVSNAMDATRAAIAKAEGR